MALLRPLHLLTLVLLSLPPAFLPAAQPPAPARLSSLRIEGATTHPTVFLTPDDVRRGRENTARHPWARTAADSITSSANAWLSRSDDWIRAAAPAPGACFSYGITGCPRCGGSLGIWAAARASFDDPGHVLCSNGHRLPDDDHPDTGTGYLARDGRIHYLVGSYNAWAVENLTFEGANNLAYAYTLTGKEPYAEKASLILDALAHVYPTCTVGSWDYPDPRNSGRFNRPQYQVARVLIHYVNQYDQLFHSPAMDLPSVRPGLTRRENIERNLLLNGGQYCYEKSFKGGLNNGVADYQRGALAVGISLGVPEYVRWSVDGPYGIRTMIENNVGRDGTYYETASGYAWHARELYVTFAEMLRNYRGSIYPEGLNLYRNPRFASYLHLHNLRFNCTGFTPSYGDARPLTGWNRPTSRPFDATDYGCLERLYSRADDTAGQVRLAGLLNWLTGGNADERRSAAEPGLDPKWLLFHGRDLPPQEVETPPDARQLLSSDFLGQKGFVTLRAGRNENAQAALFRFGPSLNHGNFDDLGFSYYGRGYDLTYDLGYLLASSHAYGGWAKQTASHNLVVVNEASQGKDTSDFTGGSLHLFADLPSVKVTEASSENSYATQGVSLYRRTLALVADPSTTHTYLVDLFRVRGGRTHDYFFHALGDKATFEGIDFAPPRPGSLAGETIAWGDKILIDGDIQGHPNKPYWVAPPGNGYGFLMEPREGRAAGSSWSADWEVGTSGTRLRLVMAADPGTTVVTAWAPGILPTLPKARYVVARRAGENCSSVFAAASEPHDGTPEIVTVEQIAVEGSETTVPAVALRVRLRSGAEDILYSSADDMERTAAGYRFAGRFVHLRRQGGKTVSLSAVGTRMVQGNGAEFGPQPSGWSGTLQEVDAERGIVTTSAQLPTGTALQGRTIFFSHPGYSRNTAYRIDRVEKSGNASRIVLTETCRLGLGRVDEVTSQGLKTWYLHDYARPASRRTDSGFFQGKTIRTDRGASAHVRRIQNGPPMTITLDSTDGFRPGDTFHYEDLQPGDTFRIDGLLTQQQFRHESRTGGVAF